MRKINKKKIGSVLMAAVVAMATAGCGKTTISLSEIFAPKETEGPVEIQGEPLMPSDKEEAVVSSAVQALEQKYASGNFETADYKILATLYTEGNRHMAARDILELCWQTKQDQEAYELLQTITVNAAEEEETAKQLDLLIRNLDTPEYADESISMLFSQEWFETMGPKTAGGKRSYYREADGTILYLEAGFDEQGRKYTGIWKQTEGELMVLLQTQDTLQQVVTGTEKGNYQGAFESWICVASTGDVFHEEGTFDNGILTGNYSAGVKWGRDEADIMSLWALREDMELTEYTGCFSDKGTTTLAQLPGEENEKNAVIYAYDGAEKNYLSMDTGEEAMGTEYVFTYKSLGLLEYPVFERYEPAENAGGIENPLENRVDLSNLQVRIFESNVQIYDGMKWVTMGSVAELETEAASEIPTEPVPETTEGNRYGNRGGGQVTAKPTAKPTAAPTAKPTAAPTAKPAAKPTAAPTAKPTAKPTTKPTAAPTAKPTAVPTAAPTAVPTQAPTAAPTAVPTAVPTQAPTAVPTAVPTAAPTAAPTQAPTGGDTDIEWTPDIE